MTGKKKRERSSVATRKRKTPATTQESTRAQQIEEKTEPQVTMGNEREL
jgi:hypothetical protein